MTAKPQYLLDANVLMEAKRRYYRFGLFPRTLRQETRSAYPYWDESLSNFV